MSSNDQNSGNKKMYCILCYIFILWLVGMTQMPQDEDVKFHVNQGIIVTIAWVIAGIIYAIPVIGTFVLGPIASIAVCVLAIIGILNANNGVQKELPLIGKFQIYK